MKIMKLLTGLILVLCLCACEVKIEEKKRIQSPDGKMEVIIFSVNTYTVGETQIQVVPTGEKLVDGEFPDYQNLRIVSDLSEPFILSWLNNCDLLVRIKKGAVRRYNSMQRDYCINEHGKKVRGNVYLIYVPDGFNGNTPENYGAEFGILGTQYLIQKNS